MAPSRRHPKHAAAQAAPATTAPAWRLPLLIFGVVALVFANGVYGQFVFDDVNNIAEDPEIKNLGDLARIAKINIRRAVVYYSLALNWAYGGADPTSYHVVNILIHATAAVVLYDLVRLALLTPRLAPRYGRHAAGLAAAVALMWGVHPLQTQSVTYIVQRTESLMGLLFLLTLWCTARGALGSPSHARRFYIGAAVACWLGMFTKEVMIVCPFTLLLFDATILSTSWREPFAKRWALYLVCFAASAALAINSSDATVATYNATTPAGPATTRADFVQTQPEVILHYIRLAFWPDQLCIDYHWPVERSTTAIAASGAVIALLLIVGVALLFCDPPLGFVGVWFFFTLAPSSSVVAVLDLAYEHRMYLALASLAVLTVFGVWNAWQRFVDRSPNWESRRLSVPTLLLACAVLALGVRTIARNADYWNVEHFWRTTIDQRPDNPRAYINLAEELDRSKRSAEAIPNYEKAIALGDASRGDSLHKYHYRLGMAYLAVGRSEDAVREFTEAARLDPNFVEAHWSNGMTLSSLHRNAEAIASLKQAVALAPAEPSTRNRLAELLVVEGDFAGALEQAQRALQLEPNRPSALIAQAEAQLGQADYVNARRSYEKVLRVAPFDGETIAEYAWLLAACPDDSVRDANLAIRTAHSLLARLKVGSAPSKIEALARDAVAAALADQEQFAEAVPVAQRAAEVARTVGDEAGAKRIEARRARYEQRETFRLAPTPADYLGR